MLLRPNEWKSLRSRYEEDRPHKMLALDGGGIRGLITLGILGQIEELIHQKTGQKLCEFFDYIAGTSTGAIIAAGLSLGKTTGDLVDFYQSCGKEMFEPSSLVQRLKCLYTADPLRAKLSQVFGENTTLAAPESSNDQGLKCLLLALQRIRPGQSVVIRMPNTTIRRKTTTI